MLRKRSPQLTALPRPSPSSSPTPPLSEGQRRALSAVLGVDTFDSRALAERARRRAAHLGLASLDAYLQHLRGSADERLHLLRELLGPAFADSNASGAPGETGPVAARRQAERALRDSELGLLQRVLQQAPIPMMLHDDAGRILELSDAWTALTGFTADELSTVEAWLRRARGSRADELLAELRRTWGTDAIADEVEIEVWTKTGESKALLFNSAPLGQLSDGRRIRICAAADVTRQKRAESALREADRQKDQFLAMLGHELRNPLAAIRTAADLLKMTHGEDPSIVRTQAILDRQTAQMASVIDGLLDASRIVRGKIRIEKRRIDLIPIVREVAQRHAELMQERGLALTMELEDEPVWIDGDQERMAQVVDNLVTNAVKFTDPPGRVVIVAGRDAGTAVVAVVDSGAGIDGDLLPHIFEPFRQASQPLHRYVGGLGLGLALVKGVVELHGGTVSAESAGPGQGASFVARMPLSERPSAEPPPPRRSARPTRMLVVEDNQDTADVLRDVLQLAGHEVTVAYRGEQGLALARELRPDVILCDIGLPGELDGYDVARAVRGDGALDDTYLVALTGYGLPEDKRRAREAGFDAHLTKPIHLAAIESVLRVAEEAN